MPAKLPAPPGREDSSAMLHPLAVSLAKALRDQKLPAPAQLGRWRERRRIVGSYTTNRQRPTAQCPRLSPRRACYLRISWMGFPWGSFPHQWGARCRTPECAIRKLVFLPLGPRTPRLIPLSRAAPQSTWLFHGGPIPASKRGRRRCVPEVQARTESSVLLAPRSPKRRLVPQGRLSPIRPVQEEWEPVETRWKVPGSAHCSHESALFRRAERKAPPTRGPRANRKPVRRNSYSKALPASARCGALEFRSPYRWEPALAAVAAQRTTRKVLLRRRERDSIGRPLIGLKVALAPP